MDFYYKYDEILEEAPNAYKGYWDSLYESFHETTLLRNNWIIKSQDKFFLTQEIEKSRGMFSWNYVVDEWCFVADCFGLMGIKNYLGIPPHMDGIIQVTMDNMSFAFNSSFIFDQLKDIRFAKNFHREEINKIDCVNTYMLFDFGELEIKTELEKRHHSTSIWATKAELSQLDLPLHQAQTVFDVFEEFEL